MNCRFSWCINMKAQIERYNYKNKETITEIYELEDTPKIHNALKTVCNEVHNFYFSPKELKQILH